MYLFDLFDVRVFIFMVDLVRPHSLLSFVQSNNLSREIQSQNKLALCGGLVSGTKETFNLTKSNQTERMSF